MKEYNGVASTLQGSGSLRGQTVWGVSSDALPMSCYKVVGRGQGCFKTSFMFCLFKVYYFFQVLLHSQGGVNTFGCVREKNARAHTEYLDREWHHTGWLLVPVWCHIPAPPAVLRAPVKAGRKALQNVPEISTLKKHPPLNKDRIS